MNTKTFQHKFNLGQEVYHITPDSPKGVIIDIRYSLHNNKPAYVVSLGFQEECICDEHELTEDKRF